MVNYYVIILITTVMLAYKTKTYSVENIKDEEVVVTGSGDSKLWKKAKSITDFTYPWENKRSTTTSFKALHNKEWFYCLYEVQDSDIKVYVKDNNKLEVINSDRVEIFFRRDEKLTPYYCLELDPNGRVLDYEAEHHRKFNPAWSWPTGQLKVKASRTSDGYIVEVAIRKESLLKLGLLKDNRIEAGIFRAECVSLVGDQANMSWISWLTPTSETPDFHIASAFGTLMFED